MAISLPHYFDLTGLPQSTISDVWYEPAGTTGDFTINSTGSFNRQLNNSGSDFTLICTIDRYKGGANSGAVEIIAATDWTFGIDASNFFFIQSKVGEAYSFDQINIGGKTCFSLSKNGGGFTLTNFNVPSQIIEKSQTQFFGPSSNLTGTGLYFAGGNPISGVKNFYGRVDQLLLLNQPISTQNLAILFSGFLQQNLTYTPISNSWNLAYSSWENTSGYSSGQLNFLKSGAQYFATDVLTNFNTSGKASGGYYGEMTLNGPTTYTEVTKIDPVAFINPCTTFGLTQINTHSVGTETGFPSSFNVPVFLNYFNPALFAFDFSVLNPGMSLDLTYQITGGQTASLAPNTGYYTGFIMNGGNAPGAQVMNLGYFPTTLDKINQVAVFDIVKSAYYAPGAVAADKIYLDGVAFTDYTISGDYITLNGTGNIGELIYDKVPQSQFVSLHSGSGNAKTGNYFIRSSAAFTGLRTIDYLETHQYHLYFNKNIPSGSTGEIYSNTDLNWL